MEKNDIIKVIDKYAKFKKESYNPDIRLEDLGYSSLAFVSLIMHLEQQFNIKFEDEYLSMDVLSTVSAVIQYVSKRVKCSGN